MITINKLNEKKCQNIQLLVAISVLAIKIDVDKFALPSAYQHSTVTSTKRQELMLTFPEISNGCHTCYCQFNSTEVDFLSGA